MKKLILTLTAMIALTTQVLAMSYEQARNEALFLTDKMAYELNLTDAQYEAAYEINLDYLMMVTNHDNVYGTYWERRNIDLHYVLYQWQWEAFCAAHYFYRPLRWEAGVWHFSIYIRYPHRTHFYFGRPHFYASYRGNHSWHHNGHHSYYEHHRNHYRPESHRDHHFGMRDSWNRGDFRATSPGSSTRITGQNHHSHHPDAQQGRPDSHNNHPNAQQGRSTAQNHHPNAQQGQQGQRNNPWSNGTPRVANSRSSKGLTARSGGSGSASRPSSGTMAQRGGGRSEGRR